ncbi:NAD(P)/FAD-dependent oxidoreductase [Mariniblastus fucicola]|uniref:NADH:ubiquinone reductase (non-electrogenic) n=1 Tax=Mariniblastus fucicola TaxID=980251 RepID=A0A5B9PD02_9BACT|nr:NAD(P)/FAD-dependent oxidoreductase [Mariniblastus fucicola]QEG23399.1 NADH dehydrogenase-like protein YjlD [Mariniblastus fucicola]
MGKNLNQARKHVVIVGGGFGGMNAARALRKSPVDITLIDRRNFHLFQPLLYQVATGGLSPANIASPLRSIFRRQKNVGVMLGNVESVDPTSRSLVVHHIEPGEEQEQAATIKYDWLIVAAGSTNSYFGHDEWEKLAPGLKTVEDATEIRGKVFGAFEAAEQESDEARRRELMTFVVVGGGPTGVELAGAIAELAGQTLKNDFRNINPLDANIIIVDGQERILNGFDPKLSRKAEKSLQRLGVEIRTGTHVTAIHRNSVAVSVDDQHSEIRTPTVLWAAGVAGVPLGKRIAAVTGVEVDRGGRIPVEADLSIVNHPEIFVVGDLAMSHDESGKPLPGVAQVAIQQGKYVGRSIANQLDGKSKASPFRYFDKGALATIGRSSAVADLGKLKFSGVFAWLIWLFVHIMSLAQFQNRVLVFLQWAWNYFTFNRSARLITERDFDSETLNDEQSNAA